MKLPSKDIHEWETSQEYTRGTLCWMWREGCTVDLWIHTDKKGVNWGADWADGNLEAGGQANTIDEAIAAVRDCLRGARLEAVRNRC